ncbi:hypothetical protein H6G35_32000 [Aulosira sp. FACHB-113]|uniref:hypothetical protein n=1 Tax=Tolypothrix tenuis TaxID=457083 RepID=UPI000BBCF669|nr:hypothetical protein [Aulosira sp. FACHB-113]
MINTSESATECASTFINGGEMFLLGLPQHRLMRQMGKEHRQSFGISNILQVPCPYKEFICRKHYFELVLGYQKPRSLLYSDHLQPPDYFLG